MKVMTRRSLIAGGASLGIVLAGPVFAQRPGGRRGDPQRMLDREMKQLKDRLKLTPDEETKVRTILEDNGKKMMELREKYGRPEPGQGPPPELMTEMSKIRDDTHDRLSKVLTADQMKDYGKLMEERRSRMRSGGRRWRQQQ